MVKLLANLSTEEEFAQQKFMEEKEKVQEFIKYLVKAIDKRTID